MRIAFILDCMVYGGIERVSIDYMNLMIRQGHKLDVYILNPKVEDIVKEIPQECNVRYVNFPKTLCPESYWVLAKRYKWGKVAFPVIYSVLSFLTPIMKLFKGSFKKYDLAIAFSGHYNDLTYAASYVNTRKRLAWVHGSLSGYFLISPGFAFLYNKMKNLVVLSNDSQEEALITNKLKDCNITKIYNPVFIKDRVQDDEKIEKLKTEYGEFALMVGRFSSQKDHLTVIDAIKILKEKYNKLVKTVFVGDGPSRANVEMYARDNDVSNLIVFEGTQNDVQNYYKAARIFVHSSPSEGLPTVLLESMSFGVPIVATDSKPGVREILGEGDYGLICPVKDAGSMADKINQLLTDEAQYSEYARRGNERIKDFAPEVISSQLEKLLNKIGSEA
ncbi:glycosyltransferase [Bacillus sp. T33-2]|uniref:glycosyltransferase n=1 Tax=Bacillus sp. T33-2 TaxID=2054168 RepID=UPI000C78FFC2|nr:glycosyltransferase [Bacillus sp. T33-2]PLR91238.1 hypothetical protein CVD19_21855 [Bacillus sp. T33-2]